MYEISLKDDLPKKIDTLHPRKCPVCGKVFWHIPFNNKRVCSYHCSLALERKKKPRGRTKGGVNCYSLDGTFLRKYESVKAASIDTGIHTHSIYACCNKEQKRAKKYLFRWCVEDEK